MRHHRSGRLSRWALLLSVGALGASGGALGQERRATAPPDFRGRMLVSVSDADMLPSAYMDGNLGPAAGADALSVVRLDRPMRDYRATEIGVGNSVTGPPTSVAVTPDGRFAVVVETRGPRPADKPDPKLTDLADGRAITVVDLSVADRPRVVQRIDGFARPDSVSINPAGTLVAVTHSTEGDGGRTPLAFYRFGGGRLSAPLTPPVPGWVAGEGIVGTAFHPTENVLALLNVTTPALSFVRVSDASDGGIGLTPWGNAIEVEKAPYVVRFTPDGRHALTKGSYAAFDYNADDMPAPRGTITSVRVAGSQAPDGSPEHRFVSRAETSVIPEGLSISPDGRWAVTANLEASGLLADDPRLTRFSSMSLIRIDPRTGMLNAVGDFAFDGVLPEAAVFDNASRHVAVTVFSRFDDARARGSIDFWRLETDPFDPQRVELVKTRHAVPVTRGVHSMAIVR